MAARIYQAVNGTWGAIVDGFATHHDVVKHRDGTFSVGFDGEWIAQKVSREEAAQAAARDWAKA